jgi:hypothetical protein
MTATLVIAGAVLIGVGLVASQLFRLKYWLDRQPPAESPPAAGDPDDD